MGITEQGLDFLVSARKAGVSFETTMTIGRQSLLVAPDRLVAMLDGIGAPDGRPFALPRDHDGFAEPVFERLGAREVCSVDASAFEGATYSHDLNTPLPRSLSARFSAVVDGGALEHVFDFPTAMRNSMQMVEPGGRLLCISPANNAAGHGFYQFSPDLYFRVLAPANGFAVERMLLAEVHRRALWYQVVDPAVRGRRVEFTTRRQAYLYVQGRRLDDGPVLATTPVQSDYAVEWLQWRGSGAPAAEAGPVSSGGDGVRARPADHLVAPLRAAMRRYDAVAVPVRALRRAAGNCRPPRHRLDPAEFRPLGRRLS